MQALKVARVLLRRQNFVLTQGPPTQGGMDGQPMDMMYKLYTNTYSRLSQAIKMGLSRLYSTAPTRPFTVAVEGNIGSGKTMLLNHFANSPHVEALKEPVDKWRNVKGENALALMYEDPSRWALTFQTYVQLTMLETHLKPTEKPVKLMERSIYSAKYCFVENLRQSKKMPDIEYIVLTRWFDWIVKNEDCGLDLIVYLRTEPETVYERIKKRGRKEEKPIPMEYLRSLHELHEDWLIGKKSHPLPCPVLVLDANNHQDDMVQVYEQNQKQILGARL